MQLGDLSFFSLPGDCRVPSLASVKDLLGRVAAQAVERVHQELPQRAGVAFAEQLGQRFERHFLRGSTPP